MRGRMYEGHQIKGIKISFKVNNPEIFIEGSIYAKDGYHWIVKYYTFFI